MQQFTITASEMELLLRAKEARRKGNEYRKARRQRPEVKLREAARREERNTRGKVGRVGKSREGNVCPCLRLRSGWRRQGRPRPVA